MSDFLYISIDGNNIGKRLEQYILSEQFDTLKSFSNRVTAAISDMSHFIIDNGGMVLMSGGDNLLATMPKDEFCSLKCFFDGIQYSDIAFAMGVGHNARASFLALKYAKAIEADCVVYEDVFPDN